MKTRGPFTRYSMQSLKSNSRSSTSLAKFGMQFLLNHKIGGTADRSPIPIVCDTLDINVSALSHPPSWETCLLSTSSPTSRQAPRSLQNRLACVEFAAKDPWHESLRTRVFEGLSLHLLDTPSPLEEIGHLARGWDSQKTRGLHLGYHHLQWNSHFRWDFRSCFQLENRQFEAFLIMKAPT